jgi:pimeloyl-ACP methyl ester carboxylesterase
VDLNEVHLHTLARDLAEVRRALGVTRWDVLAVSYGTRVAEQLARLDPAAIGKLVLDSPLPVDEDYLSRSAPNAFAAIKATLTDCRSPACAALTGDAFEQANSLVRELQQHPRPELTHSAFVRRLATLQAQEGFGDAVPRAVLQARRASPLPEPKPSPELSLGTHLSVVCASEFDEGTPQRVRAAERKMDPGWQSGLSAEAYLRYCRDWPVTRRSRPGSRSGFARAVLILSGVGDPSTPVEFARRAQRQYPDAALVVLENASHEVTRQRCAMQVVARFLEPSVRRAADYEVPDCAAKASSD